MYNRKAAIASKLCSYRAKSRAAYTRRPSPLNRPSVSSPQSRKCPTIPFNSTPNCANSILEAAFPCIANED
jgi:hypothetical protein